MVMLFENTPRPSKGMPSDLTHLAVRAVRPDEVASADRPGLAAIDVGDQDLDAVSVLRDTDDLTPLDHLGSRGAGAAPEDRLESALGDEQAAARTERVVDPDVEAGDDVGELAARQGVHADDRALRQELLRRSGLHFLFDACRPEQLDRAQVEVRSARHGRAAPQPLDHERGHAVLGEEHGGREPHEAPTGDHDGMVALRHVRTLAQSCERRCAS